LKAVAELESDQLYYLPLCVGLFLQQWRNFTFRNEVR